LARPKQSARPKKSLVRDAIVGTHRVKQKIFRMNELALGPHLSDHSAEVGAIPPTSGEPTQSRPFIEPAKAVLSGCRKVKKPLLRGQIVVQECVYFQCESGGKKANIALAFLAALPQLLLESRSK